MGWLTRLLSVSVVDCGALLLLLRGAAAAVDCLVPGWLSVIALSGSNLPPCLALGVLHDGAALAAVALGGALLLQHRVVHRREGKVASGGADDRGRRLLAARLPSRAKEKALGIGDKE